MLTRTAKYLGLLFFVFCMACASSKASIELPNGGVVEVGARGFLRGNVEHEFAVISEEQMTPVEESPIILAGDPVRYTGTVSGSRHGYRGRIRINLYERDSSRTVPTYTPYSSKPDNPCFPHRCGAGISGPYTNPEPRAEEDKPTCYYDQAGVLFYEKPGANCPYIRRFNSHSIRVEKRRQEWLKKQRQTAEKDPEPQGQPDRKVRRGETVPEGP